MGFKSRVFFLFSISLHGLLALALFFTADERSTTQVIEIRRIETASPPNPAKLKLKQALNSTATRGTVSQERLKRVDLGIGSTLKSITAKNETLAENPGMGRAAKQALMDPQLYNDAMTEFFGGDESWGFYQHVFERIDQNLKFDSLLAQYNHFGTVFVEFVVGPDGRLRSDSIKVTAMDAILKVHALRAMRAALREPFDLNKQKPETNETRFRVKFEFLQGSSSVNRVKQENFTRPVLVFRRATSEKPTATSLGEHLTSGGISHDPFAMAERWQKYSERKTRDAHEFDPFSHYRRDPDYVL